MWWWATVHILGQNPNPTILTINVSPFESATGIGFEVSDKSRLGCQVEYTEDLDGIELTLGPD